MPRPCQRSRLESGLKLDINKLARDGVIQPGASSSSGIRWTNSYGAETASGFITTEATGPDEWFPNKAWCRIQIGNLHQRIILVSRPRHFGGRQWYFVCPRLKLRVSVLWKPPEAHYFACRQHWRRHAYNSQWSTPVDRAHQGKARINSRLCSIGDFDPDEWEFPPKPKWMRWSTYNRAEEKFERYEAFLRQGMTAHVLAKFMKRV